MELNLRVNDKGEVVEVTTTESQAPMSSIEVQRQIDGQEQILVELKEKLAIVKAFEEENNISYN